MIFNHSFGHAEGTGDYWDHWNREALRCSWNAMKEYGVSHAGYYKHIFVKGLVMINDFITTDNAIAVDYCFN
jgi:hypothetical protein